MNAFQGQQYFYNIPRDTWFVRRMESENKDAFSLIGCTVAPGYDDEDIITKTFTEIEKELEK